MNKKLIMALLLVTALAVAAPLTGMAASTDENGDQIQLQDQDQDQDQDQIQDQDQDKLQDGSCQTDDVETLLEDAGVR